MLEQTKNNKTRRTFAAGCPGLHGGRFEDGDGVMSGNVDVAGGCVNKVILLGNLGHDPEVRQLASGESVVNLRLATSQSWRDKETGEKRERTEWHKVAIFHAALGRIAGQYLKKGSKVCVAGRLRTRSYQDQGGANRTWTEVVMDGPDCELALLPGGQGPAVAVQAGGIGGID